MNDHSLIYRRGEIALFRKPLSDAQLMHRRPAADQVERAERLLEIRDEHVQGEELAFHLTLVQGGMRRSAPGRHWSATEIVHS